MKVEGLKPCSFCNGEIEMWPMNLGRLGCLNAGNAGRALSSPGTRTSANGTGGQGTKRTARAPERRGKKMDDKEKLPINIQAVIDLANKHPLEIRVRVLEEMIVLLVSVLLCNFGSHTTGSATYIESEIKIGIQEIYNQLRS